MEFEWDTNKAKLNLKKHGIDFANTTSVLKDEAAITIFDEHPDEDRFITIGMNDFNQILVVVYTFRNNKYRIISARKANKRECQQYLNQSL